MNKFQHNSLQILLKWVIIYSITSVLVGSASAFFLLSLEWVTNFRENHIWIISFLPLIGFIIGLIYFYFGKEVESGNNLLIENIQKPGKKVPFIMAPLVYIGTILTHLFGGSAGREGTALQMAGAISDQFSIPFKLTDEERKILLIASVSAGFGSVFGTPFAGAIFGLELVFTGRLNVKAILPAFFTALFASFITDIWPVTHTHYHISIIPTISFPTIFYSIITGAIFGICASIFCKGLHLLSEFAKSNIKYPPLRPLLGGIVIVLIVYLLNNTKFIGLGIPTILESFETQSPAYYFALKLFLTIITLGFGFKGGEVTPLFFIGATLGSSLALFIPLPNAILAGMGFVAVFAGATNTPIACTIMGIELFGIESGVFIAIACVVSYFVSGNTSIYKAQLVKGKRVYFLFPFQSPPNKNS